MPNSPRVLVADDDVSDLLVLRRLLRDTPYAVDTVRSASQALMALGKNEYAAIVADDERLPDMPGAMLLLEAERLQPRALRILLTRPERTAALTDGAKQARYQLIARPFFAKPLMASLVEHAGRWLLPGSRSEDTQKTVRPVIDDTSDPADASEPILLERPPAPGRIARRRALLTMVELVESQAGHASGHGARVSALAAVLGKELGVSTESVEAVEDAALLHDVGELAADFQRHAEASWQIARRAGLDNAALDGIKYHHERWDGRGPERLKHDAIPVIARVVAIADSWDALATARPYRAAVPIGEIPRVFAALAGNELDPELVTLFLDRKLYDLIDWTDPPRPGMKLV